MNTLINDIRYLWNCLIGPGWLKGSHYGVRLKKFCSNPRADLPAQLTAAKANVGQARMICLAVVAHCDDEAIGPGALLFELQRLPGVVVFVLVLAADNLQRQRESRKAARVLGLDPQRLLFGSFPDRTLQVHEAEISDVLRWLRDELEPSLVVTHRVDAHPDHSAVCRSVLSVFGHASGTSILHFKIPQHLPFHWEPNVFIRVSATAVRHKLRSFRSYQTQKHKDYFDKQMHIGLLVEAGHSAGSKYAEAFETDQLFLCGEAGTYHPLSLAAASSALSDKTPHDGNDVSGHKPPFILVDRHDPRVVLKLCECGCGTIVLAGSSALVGG